MTYPRLNLLKKSEQRYQGAVSRRFIMISVVATPILLVAVLSAFKLMQYTALKSDLQASREIWKNREPKLNLYTEERKILDTNRSMISLFEAWEASRLPMVDLLGEVQEIVPGNVQFTRFLLRSEIAPAVYSAAAEMQLNFQFQIEGLAQGDRAEEDIWRFHRQLLGTDSVGAVFESIELADMRKRQGSQGSAVREFRIIGMNSQEGAK